MVTEPVNEPPALIVLYDGACPWCRREIDPHSDLKPNPLVCLVNFSDAALPLPPGTTREQLLARFHVRSRVGELLSEARAFLALWAVRPGWRWRRSPGAQYRSHLRIAKPGRKRRRTGDHRRTHDGRHAQGSRHARGRLAPKKTPRGVQTANQAADVMAWLLGDALHA